MVAGPRHFLKLFRVELDDLIEDTKLRIEMNDRRFDHEEITPYVHIENDALLKREVDAFGKFIGIIDGIDPSFYKCTSDVEADFLAKSKDFVSRREDPETVFLLIKRKLEKVRTFISSGDDDPASR